MKTKKSQRDGRRVRDKINARRRGHDRISMQVVAGHMDGALYERILSAAQDVDFAAPWDAMAPLILPVLKRTRHPYPPASAPIHLHVPPGISTGFGIDFGPAFSHVTPEMVERWGVDRATVLATALANLRRARPGRTADRPTVRFRGRAARRDPGPGLGIGTAAPP